jgi:ABC-type thiamine transport system substrate-binding protein
MKEALIQLALSELFKKFKQGKVGAKLAAFLLDPKTQDTIEELFFAYRKFIDDNGNGNQNIQRPTAE